MGALALCGIGGPFQAAHVLVLELTGMALMFLCLGFGFSGYLLPWNQLAFFATRVGTESEWSACVSALLSKR